MNEIFKPLAWQPKSNNLVSSAVQKPRHIMKTREELLAIAKDCRARFWSQVALSVLVAEAEFYEIYDICEDRNMIRFNQGKWLKHTLADFQRFDKWIAKCGKEMRNLVCDYGIQMHKRLNIPLRDLYLTFKVYFDKKGLADTEFKAKVQVVMNLINLSCDLFDGYFNVYKDYCGIDFQKDYLPARIKIADNEFYRFADDVIRYSKNDLHPAKHYASKCAYEVFVNCLCDEKIMDETGLEALKLNHEDEFLAKIERENMGFDRLKEKFKIADC